MPAHHRRDLWRFTRDVPQFSLSAPLRGSSDDPTLFRFSLSMRFWPNKKKRFFSPSSHCLKLEETEAPLVSSRAEGQTHILAGYFTAASGLLLETLRPMQSVHVGFAPHRF